MAEGVLADFRAQLNSAEGLLAYEQALTASPILYSQAAARVFDALPTELSSLMLEQVTKIWVQTTSKASVEALLAVKGTACKTLFATASRLSAADTPSSLSNALKALTNMATKTLRPKDEQLFSSYATTIAAALYDPRPATSSPAPVSRVSAPAQTVSAFGAFYQPGQSRHRAASQARSASSFAASDGTRTGSSLMTDGSANRDRRIEVQLDALQCLIAVATVSPTALHAHWHLFLPVEMYSFRRHDNLLALVEFSKSSSVRQRACQALNALLQRSTAFLNLADDRQTQSSFTALSSRLAGTITTLHAVLQRLLKSTTHQHHAKFSMELAQLVRKVALHSPYHRLRQNLLMTLYPSMLDFVRLQEPDRRVQLVAFSAARVLLEKGGASSAAEQFARDLAPLALKALDTCDDQEEIWWLLGAVETVCPNQAITSRWLNSVTAAVQGSVQPTLGLLAFACTFFGSSRGSLPTNETLDAAIALCAVSIKTGTNPDLALSLLGSAKLQQARPREACDLLCTMKTPNHGKQAVAHCKSMTGLAGYAHDLSAADIGRVFEKLACFDSIWSDPAHASLRLSMLQCDLAWLDASQDFSTDQKTALQRAALTRTRIALEVELTRDVAKALLQCVRIVEEVLSRANTLCDANEADRLQVLLQAARRKMTHSARNATEAFPGTSGHEQLSYAT